MKGVAILAAAVIVLVAADVDAAGGGSGNCSAKMFCSKCSAVDDSHHMKT